jgi:hypothetical protein
MFAGKVSVELFEGLHSGKLQSFIVETIVVKRGLG